MKTRIHRDPDRPRPTGDDVVVMGDSTTVERGYTIHLLLGRMLVNGAEFGAFIDQDRRRVSLAIDSEESFTLADVERLTTHAFNCGVDAADRDALYRLRRRAKQQRAKGERRG